MPDPVRITEADLRSAMREPRYWQLHHPERDAFTTWVTKGWYSLMPRDAPAKGSVWVRAYVREGHKVAAHWRGAPPGGMADGGDKSAHGKEEAEDDDDLLTPAVWWRLRGILRGPAGRRGSGGPPRRPPPRDPDRRRPGPDGRDRVDDLRSAPETIYEGRLTGGGEQWFRPGGVAGRQRDLESLSPLGQPEQLQGGIMRVQLPEGRFAMIRNSTTGERFTTMDIFESAADAGRGKLIAKIRYP